MNKTESITGTVIDDNTHKMSSEKFTVSLDAHTFAPLVSNENFDYGDVFMYPGYSFERPVYLYVWEILVLLTLLQNILIVLVLMQKKMRNPTNIVLSAIAISDSLTGLVTLPTYIMVFQRYDPLDYDVEYIDQPLEYENGSSLNIGNSYNENSTTTPFVGTYLMNNLTGTLSPVTFSNSTEPSNHASAFAPVDGYTLTKTLCQNFMISKYFLSKSFHTVSIFLTLFLEIQRYVAMAHPYTYDRCLNRLKVVNLYCILTFLLSPILHAFHLYKNKADGGLCQWALSGPGCGEDCIYLWISFIVRHFIPCVTLVIFTVLFIHQLRKGEKNFRRTDSSSSQYTRRVSENRRISFIVTTVVVVRLIPEIPYSIFLLFNSLDVTINKGKEIDIETNRIFHLCYEICLVCSFLAHFYIYIIFNRKFRKRLYKMFCKPVRVKFNESVAFYSFPSWYRGKKGMNKRADSVRPPRGMSSKTNSIEESDNREAMIKRSCESDIAAQIDTDNVADMPLTNGHHEIIA
ncbi:sex peptide receptor-like [Ruditapes philippinarum]|uniref:sex peptide receptor-like n=1 Tax=Ruditapes philippinarum TaxID=129788 RepID=UPI00295B5F97|nr:sex peptide receptor-like [Ruditapes philippinarum]XP_060588675.1 sex peptide receptor-like [Ruditapes philippinarum]